MVKLKKYALEQIPKFIVYSLDNIHLSEHIKHIKVYAYSQDRDFQKIINTFFVSKFFNISVGSSNSLRNLSVYLHTLIFFASEYKNVAKLRKFTKKVCAESQQLKPYLGVPSKSLAFNSDFIWSINILLMDTWNYD